MTTCCGDCLMRLAKCKIVHIGESEEEHVEYSMDGLITNAGRGLTRGFHVWTYTSHLTFDGRFISTWLLRRQIKCCLCQREHSNQTVNLWKMLYVFLIRSHLEFAFSICSMEGRNRDVWEDSEACDGNSFRAKGS